MIRVRNYELKGTSIRKVVQTFSGKLLYKIIPFHIIFAIYIHSIKFALTFQEYF